MCSNDIINLNPQHMNTEYAIRRPDPHWIAIIIIIIIVAQNSMQTAANK